MLVSLKRAGRLNAGEGVVLKPGPNTVDAEKWAKCRVHPSIAKKLEVGEVVEETEFKEAKAAPKGPKKPADNEVAHAHLQTLKQPQANSLVKETTDVELLTEWQRRETRPQVKGVIKKQIELMSRPLEPRDRTASRQISTGKGPQEIQVNARPNAQDD